MDTFSVDIIKGWTRSTCVATIVAAAAEIDLSDAAGKELLKPLHSVLDKCWLIPVHVTLDGLIFIFANLEVQKIKSSFLLFGVVSIDSFSFGFGGVFVLFSLLSFLGVCFEGDPRR